MKKKYFALLLLLLVFASGCTQAKQAGVTATQTPVQTQATQQTASNDISVKDFAFQPSELTINKGESVIWTNFDAANHIIRENTGLFESAKLNQGQSYSYKFETAGTYEYHCTIHPNMVGKIIVR